MVSSTEIYSTETPVPWQHTPDRAKLNGETIEVQGRELAFAYAVELNPSTDNLVHFGLTQLHLGKREFGDAMLWQAFAQANAQNRLPDYNQAARDESAHWIERGEWRLARRSLGHTIPLNEEPLAQQAESFYLAACIAAGFHSLREEVMNRRRAGALWSRAEQAGETFFPSMHADNERHLQNARSRNFIRMLIPEERVEVGSALRLHKAEGSDVTVNSEIEPMMPERITRLRKDGPRPLEVMSSRARDFLDTRLHTYTAQLITYEPCVSTLYSISLICRQLGQAEQARKYWDQATALTEYTSDAVALEAHNLAIDLLKVYDPDSAWDAWLVAEEFMEKLPPDENAYHIFIAAMIARDEGDLQTERQLRGQAQRIWSRSGVSDPNDSFYRCLNERALTKLQTRPKTLRASGVDPANQLAVAVAKLGLNRVLPAAAGYAASGGLL